MKAIVFSIAILLLSYLQIWTMDVTTGGAEPVWDLAITSDTIAPNFICNKDGNHILVIQLQVLNKGNASLEKDFIISLQDDKGNLLKGYWYGDFNGPLPIPVKTQNNPSISIPWPINRQNCSYRFTASIDAEDEIPEYSEDNNDAKVDYILNTQNIKIDSVSSICTDDGLESVRVVIANNGCSPTASPFVLSIEDNKGNIERQTITILPPEEKAIVFDDWPASCTPEGHTFTIVADTGKQVCELDRADNVLTTTIEHSYPDLHLDAAVEIDCEKDGEIQAAFKLIITNTTDVDIQKDFFITIDDGKGWKIEKQYQKDLGGSLPIKKSETRELSVDWTRDFSIKPMIIDYPDLQITVDSKDEICECDGTNNSVSLPYILQIPNLNLLTFTPTCVTDDYYQVILEVENNGGADIESDFTIRITDNDGKKQVKTFTEIEGTLPFKAGSMQTVLFDTWEVDHAPATLELECRLDYNRKLSELDPNDNNKRGKIQVFDMEITNLKAGTITETNKDQLLIKGFFTVTITNSGLNTINEDFAIQAVDGQGWRTEKHYAADLHGALPLEPGKSRTVTIPWDHDFSIDPPAFTFKNIHVTIDSQSDICECDGSNNQAFTNYQYSNSSLLLQLPLSH